MITLSRLSSLRSRADQHDAQAAVFQEPVEVQHVDVDERPLGHGLDDSLQLFGHQLVHHAISFHPRLVPAVAAQLLEVDHDGRVRHAEQLLDAGLRLLPGFDVIGERHRHDGDNDGPSVAGLLCDDRQRAGARALAHATDQEHQLRAFERLVHLPAGLFCGQAPGLYVTLRARPFRHALAEEKLLVGPDDAQQSLVRVGGDHMGAESADAVQVIDDVAAGAAHADGPYLLGEIAKHGFVALCSLCNRVRDEHSLLCQNNHRMLRLYWLISVKNLPAASLVGIQPTSEAKSSKIVLTQVNFI